ncbi:hypothetical protein MKW98_020861 [Papaver atlanticum]|uniref:FBD domain-containing protein n=1 Tax=Papaver atlanticum TaxID=357466 RepID=A0AAD4XTT3_9MAGN|nr:hypothetical protein MKW98_020861 [Papaver atlanticum]
MLRISDNLTTDQGLIALLAAVPNLESLVFDESINDEQEDSDEDNENGSDDAEDGGDDDNDRDSTDEGENNHGDEDEGDVSDVGENAYDDQDDSLALDTVTSGCLFPHLRSVCFQQFAGNPREMRWVKLILKNADALQMMTVRYDSDLRFVNAKSEKEVMVEIPNFSRASASCLFKFCSWD